MKDAILILLNKYRIDPMDYREIADEITTLIESNYYERDFVIWLFRDVYFAESFNNLEEAYSFWKLNIKEVKDKS